MKNFIKLLLAAVCLIGFQRIGMSQTDNHHEHKTLDGGNIDKFYLPLEYDADSLVGFDEAAAWEQARMNSSEEWMQKRFVAVLKRNYIDFHYGYQVSKGSDPTVQAPCTNPGFETGTLAGWTALQGSNTNSQTMAGCCAAATTQAVIVGPGNDPNVGAAVPMVPPGGGSFACRLGQTGTGGVSYRLNQTFTVTAANSVFIYKYAVILQDGGHSCTDQPFFNIKFETCNNVVIPCAQYQASAYGSACSSGDPSFITSGAWKYKPWQTRSFDLTAYIGQCVNIEFTVGGCVASQGAHPGYAYIDAACDPMTLELNGVDIPVGQTNTNFCAIGNNTLCAPPGFTSYTWNGPGVTGLTTQCVSASAAGSYSVTLGMQGTSCQSPVLYSNFTLVPKPIANFNFTTTPCASTFTVPFTDASSQNAGPALTNWFWDFDNNGTPDNLTQNPTNNFLAQGTYSVELKVSNGGCLDSITKVISVSPSVVASFTNTSGCLNGTTNFTATSTPTLGITSHVWNFGDGSANGSGANPSHTYTTSGTYNISYTVTNSSGCTSTAVRTVTVFPNPIMAITANTVCLNVPTVFGNTSSAAPDVITTWAWDFDNNGSIDNSTQTPTNTYGTAGNFVAILTATTNNGCVNTTSVAVKVNPLPIAAFTAGAACLNNNITLNNTSSIPAPDAITTSAWNFGAGATPATSAVSSPPSLVYTTPGIKNITLNLTSNNTCTATVTQTVMVNPQPVANFTTTSVCQGTASTFTDVSTPTGSITAWAWDFTNNGSVDNATNAPSNMFSPSGTYTTNLIVTDVNGCKDTVALPVNVWGHSIPDFSPTNVCFGAASTFSNQTNTTTNANVGGTPGWDWNFGDGSVNSNLQDPVHSYTSTAVSVYNVTLTATTTNGCVDNVVKTVTVNVLPTATFTPVNACLNNNVLLGNTSSIPLPDNITSYVWNFGANAAPTATSIAQNPLGLTYTSSGIKVITLTVTANTSCSATVTHTVEVYPQPVANFSTSSVCQGTATAYTDLSTTAVGTMTAWAWDFTNNGSTDNATNAPTNIYPSSGTYTTNLIVTTSNGCKDTIALPVNVWGHSIPNFVPNTVCFGSMSTFTNTTDVSTNANVGGTPNWLWDFGDGSLVTNNLQSPTYSYTSTVITSYNVTLTVTTTNGCADNITKVVNMNVLPTATFTPVNACLNTNVLLNNTSTIPAPDAISTYTWNFGAGASPSSSSNVQNPPLLTYNSSGVKVITLQITANTTCSASITQTVTVYPQPVANFSTSSVCQGTATAYTDLSTPTGSMTAWAWDFTNNGSTDNATNAPTNVFPTSGTFTTGLIVTDNNTCKDTVKLPLDVWGHTIPNFTPDKVCFGNNSQFMNLTDETTNANTGTGSTYVWDFADSTPTSNLNNPTHIYTLGGNANAVYNVTLTATSLHNCVDVIVKPVNVYAVPTASFTSNAVCMGSSTQMTDASNGNGNAVNTYEWDYLMDGSVDVTGVANPNFIFPTFGFNNVSYTVSTSPVPGLVCSNSTNTIQVWVNPNPIPDFTFVNNCINAQPNTFNAAPSMIAIGTNTAYAWAYGDGAVDPATGVNTTTHVYATAGTYNATLTLTSDQGCQTSIAHQVEVYEKPFMTISNSTPCDQAAMTFTSVTQPGSGNIVTWSWDLNNTVAGPEGNTQTTSYTYPAPGAGTHTVSLLATTDHNCVETVTTTVYVNYVPAPLFTVNDPDGCPEHCVVFTDQSPAITGPAQITTWAWSLGDGSSTIVNNSNAQVSNCYKNSSSNQLATYNVQLTVTTDSGCVATNFQASYITVFPKPIANYVANPNPGNVLEPLIYFTNQSIDYTKWTWIFGDNSPNDSVNVDPTHFYGDATAQTYYTILQVENQYSCKDIAYLPVEIGPEFTFYIPNAFSPSNDDNINDVFTGKGIGIATYEMFIFDRWGERIYYTDDIEKGWNGKVQGKSKEGKQEVYVWKVKITDVLGRKHEYVGHVTLLR